MNKLKDTYKKSKKKNMNKIKNTYLKYVFYVRPKLLQFKNP